MEGAKTEIKQKNKINKKKRENIVEQQRNYILL